MVAISSKANVLDEQQMTFDERAEQLMREQQRQEAEEAERKRNRNFYMVFKSPDGSPTLRKLIAKDRNAAQLFFYIAETMGKDNCLVASYSALAAELGISKATICRAMKVLEEGEYLVRVKSANTSIICLNPEIVWNAWATGKDTCLFHNAKVLVAKDEQDATIRKRFQTLVQKRMQDQGALFPDEVAAGWQP